MQEVIFFDPSKSFADPTCIIVSKPQLQDSASAYLHLGICTFWPHCAGQRARSLQFSDLKDLSFSCDGADDMANV